MAGLGGYPVAGVLRADDLDRARQFYSATLGLKEHPLGGPGQTMFDSGSGTMFMIYERPGMPAPENTTLGWEVPAEKFDATVADLRAHGVVFEDYDIPEMGLKTVNGVAEMGGGKGAWFKDSEGNILNIEAM
jgi:catechol 2,3-dioxygenase-like lactoylglutathione lyase family enzyme